MHRLRCLCACLGLDRLIPPAQCSVRRCQAPQRLDVGFTLGSARFEQLGDEVELPTSLEDVGETEARGSFDGWCACTELLDEPRGERVVACLVTASRMRARWPAAVQDASNQNNEAVWPLGRQKKT